MKKEIGFTLELDTKAVTDGGEFSGYASTFGNEDLGHDVVVPGAFAKSLEQRPARKVKMLLSHDTTQPIGVWTSLAEDGKGLRATGQLILETVKGKETYALMRAGALDALSIGFKTIKDRFDRVKGTRFLEQLDLFEVSVVVFGMNKFATVNTVKSHKEAEEHARNLVRAIQRMTEALKQ